MTDAGCAELEEQDGWDARMMIERLNTAVYGEDHETDCGLEHESWTQWQRNIT
jgi:hypothetical protein